MNAAEPIRLCLEPLDVLFFRDGRPFNPATRGRSVLPMPQTLAGAVLTALFRRYDAKFDTPGEGDGTPRTLAEVTSRSGAPDWLASVAVRGPWLARLDADGEPEVLMPIPATLRRDKRPDAKGNKALRVLTPLSARRSVPGWFPPAPGLRPLWLAQRGPTEEIEGYLAREGLGRLLAEQTPAEGHLLEAEELFGFDERVGIGIHPDQLTAEQSILYGASFLALRSPYTANEPDQPRQDFAQVVLYAEVVAPHGRAEETRDAFRNTPTLPFGGEGRRVRVEPVLRSPWPEEPIPERKQRPFLLLTTPGFFANGWCPKCLEGRLVAAAVPGSVGVSGWDLARSGPKPTRFAVAAGSVYFLDTLPDDLPPDSLCDTPQDRHQGWGCYLKGVWTDE
jgi:CRISPR-associated protein Cmr3